MECSCSAAGCLAIRRWLAAGRHRTAVPSKLRPRASHLSPSRLHTHALSTLHNTEHVFYLYTLYMTRYGDGACQTGLHACLSILHTQCICPLIPLHEKKSSYFTFLHVSQKLVSVPLKAYTWLAPLKEQGLVLSDCHPSHSRRLLQYTSQWTMYEHVNQNINS